MFHGVRYENLEGSHRMDVTAFMGGRYGKCIQLTTDKDYVCLSEKQVKELIKVLQARVKNKVTSTGYENLGDFYT